MNILKNKNKLIYLWSIPKKLVLTLVYFLLSHIIMKNHKNGIRHSDYILITY